MNKHAIGPWYVDSYDGKNTREIIDSEGIIICEVRNTEVEDEDIQFLIAAAPDLLEALRNLVEMTEPLIVDADKKSALNWYDYARDAIAKATGSEE